MVGRGALVAAGEAGRALNSLSNGSPEASTGTSRSYSRSASTTRRNAVDWSGTGVTPVRQTAPSSSVSAPYRLGCTFARWSSSPGKSSSDAPGVAYAARVTCSSLYGGGASGSPRCR
ncbi:hypothetical protein SBADM41S_09026 [Streptomyces badius]